MPASLSRSSGQLAKAYNEVETAPWATMWRPAPPELVDDWRSLSRKAQAAVMQALHGLRQGESSLHLSDCELKSAGAKLVAEAMHRYPGLRNLVLSNNGIEDDGVVSLAKVVGEQQGLEMLCLSFNRVSDAGARALGSALEQHEGIRLLSLDGNCIGNTGAHRLIAALAWNKRTNITCSMVANPAPHITLRAARDLQTSAATVRELSERGITLLQLLTFYNIGCQKGTIKPTETTTGEAASTIVLPATKKAALSYVESAGPAKSSPPTTHVIHSWSSLFQDLVFNVASHAVGKRVPDLNPDSDFWRFQPKVLKRSYFIDVFCVNQHVSMNNLRDYGLRQDNVFVAGDEGCQIDKLHLVAEQIKSLHKGNVLVSIDSHHRVLTRLLCLQELHSALMSPKLCDHIDAIFTVLEAPPQGFSVCQVQNSKADDMRSREIALEEIGETGFDAFDGLIQEWLKKKYEQQLATKIKQMCDSKSPSR